MSRVELAGKMRFRVQLEWRMWCRVELAGKMRFRVLLEWRMRLRV